MPLLLLLAPFVLPPDCSHLGTPDAPAAVINDNRAPAGKLQGGAFTLSLVAQRATWFPEGEQGCGVTLFAFGEDGKPAQMPGPLIRIPVGTEVRVTVRNALPIPISMWGLRDPRRSMQEPSDSVVVQPESSHVFAFRATVPGTYFYSANGATAAAQGPNAQSLALAAGAFIIDPPGEAGRAASERIFVMSRWRAPAGPAGDLARSRGWEVTAFNGRSWPHTERLSATVGDTLRWRVIAANNDGHQMHLHGFYFLVESKGGRGIDTVYAPSERRLMVTETMGPGATMRLQWIPERAGNWIFHCHLMRHMTAHQLLERMPSPDRPGPAHAADPAHGGHAMHEMGGLVMGISVRPRGATPPDVARQRRTLHLFANQRDRVFAERPGFGFVLQEGANPPAADSVRIPGSPIVLRRGEPSRIVVHNRLRQPLSVHWHGIELDSYYDGVSGWSGASGNIAPPIAPGDSFAALITPPRTGTFIYHVHNEMGEELTSGLYGALLVVEPGAPVDLERVFVIAQPGPGGPEVRGGPPFVNGTVTPPEQELVAGRTYRLRIVTISADFFYRVEMQRDSATYPLRAVARDGADLPAAQVSDVQSFPSGPGSTRDFEVTPAEPGILKLTVEAFAPNGQRTNRPVVVTLRVRAP